MCVIFLLLATTTNSFQLLMYLFFVILFSSVLLMMLYSSVWNGLYIHHRSSCRPRKNEWRLIDWRFFYFTSYSIYLLQSIKSTIANKVRYKQTTPAKIFYFIIIFLILFDLIIIEKRHNNMSPCFKQLAWILEASKMQG